MGGLDDDVTGGVDEHPLLPGRRPPQDEHHGLGFGIDGGNDTVGEALPTLTLMRGRLMGAHRERGVQQQHALAGPRFQIAMLGCRDTEIGSQFLVDVDQRRGRSHPPTHTEAQAVRLPRSVVGVLSQDEYAHVRIRGEMQRRKHLVLGRIHRMHCPLAGHELLQTSPIGLRRFRLQHRVPVGLHSNESSPNSSSSF